MIKNSSKAPNEALVEQTGVISRAWQVFFRKISDAIAYLGDEISFPLVNEQLTPANITPLKFDSQYCSQATIEYCIQRCTSSYSFITSGVCYATYRPDAQIWELSIGGDTLPDNPEAVLSITTLGQVQYTTTYLAGTPAQSRIFFRVSTHNIFKEFFCC